MEDMMKQNWMAGALAALLIVPAAAASSFTSTGNPPGLNVLTVMLCRVHADALRDGRWLWIRPTSQADIRSIQLLLSAKRRPKPGAPHDGW